MPIYEYECGACGRTSVFLVRSLASSSRPACPKCGARSLKRAISRFSAARPAPRGGVGGGEPRVPDGLDEGDPRALGRMMRDLAGREGAPVEPEMDEMIRRLEAGEDPEDIEKRMEGADPGGSGGGGDDWYDG